MHTAAQEAKKRSQMKEKAMQDKKKSSKQLNDQRGTFESGKLINY
jgi:hypothetical protein